MRIGIIVPIAIMALCAACRSDRGSDWDKNHGSASSDYTSQDYYGPETPSGMHGTRSINDSYYAAENSSASRNARGASDPVGYERDSVTRTTEASYRRDASGARSNGKALIASERGFLENAAQWNMLEVESSQLALDRNIAGADRAFAKMMVEDHGKANRELPDLCREEDCAVQSYAFDHPSPRDGGAFVGGK